MSVLGKCYRKLGQLRCADGRRQDEDRLEEKECDDFRGGENRCSHLINESDLGQVHLLSRASPFVLEVHPRRLFE